MTRITKAKHAFDERFSRFDEDVELVDYLAGIITSGKLNDENNFLNGSLEKYTVLPRREKNKNAHRRNRILLANHLKQTIYSSYIKDIYEEVTDYLKLLVKHALSSDGLVNKKRIIGNNKITLEAKEITGFSNLEQLCGEIVVRMFQQLEQERSTLNLIQEVFRKLDIPEPEDGCLVERAITYLNIRHYLVHADGVCPEEFRTKVDQNIFKFGIKGYIRLDFDFIKSFRTTILDLVNHIDESIINLNILDVKYIHLNPAN